MNLRQGSLSDLETILRHRVSMFLDMGFSEESLADQPEKFRPWLANQMARQNYLAWFMENPAGQIVAGAGIWLVDWFPGIVTKNPQRAYIMNIYTEPAHRKCGLAKRLMKQILTWCEENGLEYLHLHASDQGRGLYENLGFEATNEMKLVLQLP